MVEEGEELEGRSWEARSWDEHVGLCEPLEGLKGRGWRVFREV